MSKPKYQIGDRFILVKIVEFEIVQVIEIRGQTAYIFRLTKAPKFKSMLTEQELDHLINQSELTA